MHVARDRNCTALAREQDIHRGLSFTNNAESTRITGANARAISSTNQIAQPSMKPSFRLHGVVERPRTEPRELKRQSTVLYYQARTCNTPKGL